MGNSLYNTVSYRSFSNSASTKTQDELFTQNKKRTAAASHDPKNIKLRECRDSTNHPASQAIMLFLDVTGSMGSIPENLIKNKFNVLIQTLIDQNVVDPAVFFGAIGDIKDNWPLQCGQFESGTDELIASMANIYIEGNGHGNIEEAYLLAWYFASRYTSIDCYEKRGQKGYLFTVGDEASHDRLTRDNLIKVFGSGEFPDHVSDEDLLKEAQKKFHVYHIHVQDGSYPNHPIVFNYWQQLLKENFIVLDDSEYVAETIAAKIAFMQGINILSAFDPKAAIAAGNALVNHTNSTSITHTDGVVTL